MRACVPPSATAHRVETNFGTEKVRSNPATEAPVGFSVSSAFINTDSTARIIWAQTLREILETSLYPLRGSGEPSIRSPQLLPGNRVLPISHETAELLLADLATMQKRIWQASKTKTNPSTQPRPSLRVIPRQRRRSVSVTIPGHHRVQQIPVPVPSRHHPDRHRHTWKVCRPSQSGNRTRCRPCVNTGP